MKVFFVLPEALIQITGRAARNSNGRVIFYADSVSKSMHWNNATKQRDSPNSGTV